MNFFDKITTKLKIKTGMEKTKKDTKAINILKEDRQAFGLLVGKITSLEEALSYPPDNCPFSSSHTRERFETRLKSSFEELPHRRVSIPL